MMSHVSVSEQSLPIVQKIIDMSGGSSNEPPDGTVDIQASRARLEKLAVLAPIKESVRVKSIDMNGVLGESILPPNCHESRIVLFLHGGAYLFGSPNSHRELAAVIAEKANAQAITPDYRLAPEHPFPAALEDVYTTYKWLLQQDIQPRQVILSGDSAGGGLVLALLLTLLEEKQPLPAAVVLLSPWTKPEATTEELIERYKGPDITKNDLWFKAMLYADGHDISDRLISPINGDYTGAPPVLIQAGGNERLLEDSTELYDRLATQGVNVTLEIWDELFHVFQIFSSMLPEGLQAVERIGKFMNQQFNL